jgi:two-component sensor histidine kinase
MKGHSGSNMDVDMDVATNVCTSELMGGVHFMSPTHTEPSLVDQEFLKEVHHRVKNNLQVVCSLLRLQGRGVSDTNARDAFKRSEERIQSMALVYDKLYKGDGHDTVPLDLYLREMIGHLVFSARTRDERPEVEYRLQPILVSSRLATSVGLLMNEVISNHLRVYCRDSIEPLLVRLVSEGSSVVIELHGMKHETAQHESLGVIEQQILDALIKQVDGVIDYGINGGGATRISFPSDVTC